MKFKGGYNVALKGKPAPRVQDLPESEVLYLPLRSLRFNFTKLCVADGQDVAQGQVLAQDPDNHSVPLLAPRAGTARIESEAGHLVIEKAHDSQEACVDTSTEFPAPPPELGETGARLDTLLRAGVWQYMADPFTGGLPDPYVLPRAVIVSPSCSEPFVPDPGVLLKDRGDAFIRGLEFLHTASGDGPIHLLLPPGNSKGVLELRNAAGQCPWLALLEIPAAYPFDNAHLAAQRLGYGNGGRVWAIGLEGVIAAGLVLGSDKPCLERIVAVGGPCVTEPCHVKTVVGYPLSQIPGVPEGTESAPVRLINGGALTGAVAPRDQRGLSAECRALTVLAENTKREVLAFADPGFGKHAFTHTFMSALRPAFLERYTTAVRGEGRPCLSCAACEDVCPAGIMPHLIHRYVNKKRLTEAARFGLGLCVECGLCSYVCPSKIEHRHEFLEAKETLRLERQAEEEHA